LYTAASPSAASFICRSIDELHTRVGGGGVRGAFADEPVVDLGRIEIGVFDLHAGKRRSKSLMSGLTSFASVVE
jgi:hypothetical protein